MRKRFLPLLFSVAMQAAAAQAEEPAAPQRAASSHTVAVASHFADGMMDGWESYPFAEDDGYDATLSPVDEPGMHGIERRSAPLADGAFRLGFIHPLHLVACAQSVLNFRYKINAAHSGAHLRIELFSGSASQSWSLVAGSTGWQSAHLDLSSVRVGTAWTALAIVLDAPAELKETAVSFALTDVELSGEGAPRLKLAQPDALWDEARSGYYLRRAYRRGDLVSVRFLAPAQLTLTRPDGSRAQMDADGSYRIGKQDPIGVWTLTAIAEQGEARVQLLVEADQHSGLFFDTPPHAAPELLNQIAGRRDELSAKVHPELAVNIEQFNARWLLPGLPSYFQLLVPPSELALDDAILFRYRNDAHALAEARGILRSMSNWPTWTHPWFLAHGQRTYYPVGLAAANLAAARAFLGDALSAEDAHALDRALMEKAIVPAYEEYVSGDRLPFSVSNWIGNTVGGSLLAALTVEDDDAAGYILGLLAKDEAHLRTAYTRDGDYGEGTSYLRFDLEMSSLVAYAVSRHLHVELEPVLRDADRYLRNAVYGSRTIVDFGDTHTELSSTDVFAYLAAESPSAETSAFYRAYRSERAELPLLRLLWDGKAMQRADVPAYRAVSAIFPERGAVLLRSGEGNDATIAAMRAGANFNHNHADQGGVQIVSGGETILGESGYADYYKDPSFASYEIQAAGHNVLLVDDNPMSQVWAGNSVAGAHPYFEQSWMGTKLHVAEAELASAYGDELESYKRWIVASQDGPIVIADRVTAKSAHRFSLLWHPASASVLAGSPHVYQIGSEKQPWLLASFASTAVETALTRGPLPLASYTQAETQLVKRPIELRVRTLSALPEASVVTVVAPEHSAGSSKDGSGAQVSFSAEETAVTAPNWSLHLRQKASTGAPLLAYHTADALLLLEARVWSQGEHSMHATVPVDMEIDSSANGATLTLRSPAAGTLILRGYGPEARRVVTASDAKTAGSSVVNVHNGELVLPITAGQQTWLLNLQKPTAAAAP